MYKKTIPFLAAILSVLFLQAAFARETRRPAVAGAFYPKSATELKAMVDGFIREAKRTEINGELIALILPHAGYIYSGPVAAYGYRQLEGNRYDTIVIMGDSHRARYPGASVGDYDYLATPLGKVKVNRALTDGLLAQEGFSFNRAADMDEHSLEVQLPFLQTVLKDFEVTWILFGEQAYETSLNVANAVVKNVEGKNALLIASTDLSHYYKYDSAVAMDSRTIDEMLKLDARGLFREAILRRCEFCATGATVSVILAARLLGADKAKLLKYANSGDTAGDRSRVVGYAAIAIYKSKP